jgi:hypothetical protein
VKIVAFGCESGPGVVLGTGQQRGLQKHVTASFAETFAAITQPATAGKRSPGDEGSEMQFAEVVGRAHSQTGKSSSASAPDRSTSLVTDHK